MEFLRCQHHLLFRATAQDAVVFRVAPDPPVSDKGIRGAGVEGVITHRHLLPLDLGISEFVTPIIYAADLDPETGLHLRLALRSRGQRAHEKTLIVGDKSCESIPSPLEAQPISLAGSLAERRVLRRVVDRVEVLAESVVQLGQMPDGLPFGSTDFVTWRTLRVIWVLPLRLWMNCVLTVPKRRSTTDPNRAFAGGRVFLAHSYLANKASKNTLLNSHPPSTTST